MCASPFSYSPFNPFIIKYGITLYRHSTRALLLYSPCLDAVGFTHNLNFRVWPVTVCGCRHVGVSEKVKPQMESIAERLMVMVKIWISTQTFNELPLEDKRRVGVAMMRGVQRAVACCWCAAGVTWSEKDRRDDN